MSDTRAALERLFGVPQQPPPPPATVPIDDAGEIILHATRRMGELLKEQERAGTRARRGQKLKRGPKSHVATMEDPPTLEALGLTKSQASRAQQLAETPAETPRQTHEVRL